MCARLTRAFRSHVLCSDTGYITRKDLRRLLGDNADEDYIDRLISEADFKGDGRVSYEEFLQLFSEKKYDTIADLYDEAAVGQQPSPKGTEDVLRRFGISEKTKKTLRRAKEAAGKIVRSTSSTSS